jgi:hypothetical protein
MENACRPYGDLPLASGGVVVLLEGEDLGGEGLQVLEIVGGEQFAVYDGEVDLVHSPAN